MATMLKILISLTLFIFFILILPNVFFVDHQTKFFIYFYLPAAAILTFLCKVAYPLSMNKILFGFRYTLISYYFLFFCIYLPVFFSINIYLAGLIIILFTIIISPIEREIFKDDIKK